MKDITLFRHQEIALEYCSEAKQRLIFRLPGTGKTYIGLELVKREMIDKGQANILWIGPANLINQYHENFHSYGIKFHDIFPDRILSNLECNICSYDMVRLQIDFLTKIKWDVVVCDEIHKAKNNNTKINHALWKLRKKAKKWFAFTGTPFQNNPYEFFELVSLCLNKNITFECEMLLLYRTPKLSPIRNFLRRLGFNLHRPNQGPIIGIKEPKKLHDKISTVIDYIKPEDYLSECNLPIVESETVYVNLTPNEEKLYVNALHQFSRKKIFKKFISDKLEDEKIDGCFKGLSTLRTIALRESKPSTAIKLIRSICSNNEDARILVFCNFVEIGLNILSSGLKKQSFPHLSYSGQVSISKRAEFIHKYLSGQKNVLLLSPVGFEGLDLYGTTHIIILDPHYNPERTKQLTSRAIRAFSDVRKIKIINLLSQSNSIKVPVIDTNIMQIAERKAKIAKMLEEVLSM